MVVEAFSCIYFLRAFALSHVCCRRVPVPGRPLGKFSWTRPLHAVHASGTIVDAAKYARSSGGHESRRVGSRDECRRKQRVPESDVHAYVRVLLGPLVVASFFPDRSSLRNSGFYLFSIPFRK